MTVPFVRAAFLRSLRKVQRKRGGMMRVKGRSTSRIRLLSARDRVLGVRRRTVLNMPILVILIMTELFSTREKRWKNHDAVVLSLGMVS